MLRDECIEGIFDGRRIRNENRLQMASGGSVAAVAQPVERVLGKDEVMGSNPISS